MFYIKICKVNGTRHVRTFFPIWERLESQQPKNHCLGNINRVCIEIDMLLHSWYRKASQSAASRYYRLHEDIEICLGLISCSNPSSIKFALITVVLLNQIVPRWSILFGPLEP